jgi:hypothetical protein
MEEFETLSELSIATAGFAALASILKPKSEDVTSKFNLIRFYVMIEFALTVAAFSFLPIVLKSFISEEFNFRISSAVLFTFSLLLFGNMSKRNKRLGGNVNFGDFYAKISRIISLLAVVSLLLNASGIFGQFFREVYLIALYIFYLSSLFLFYRLIIKAIRPE